MSSYKAAIIGSGNIGTDLMYKIERLSDTIELIAIAGVDVSSDGLAHARKLGKATTANSIEGLVKLDEFGDVDVVFDASSAASHHPHDAVLASFGKRVIDLTPAALGPFVVPSVNLHVVGQSRNLNMVTCGGQATIPIVAAINGVTKVHYAEIVASIASRSAGPGTRANIDEFTETTADAIKSVGGATHGKAIIILNPAEPAMIMRDTIFCMCDDGDTVAITAAVEAMVQAVQEYVPGYRLKQKVQFESIGNNAPLQLPEMDHALTGLKVSVFLEVEGAGHYLPPYAGNLDIMTSAALRVGEQLAVAEVGKS